MQILFIRNSYAFPDLYAGTEMTMHWLCLALATNGHGVAVAAVNDSAVANVDRQSNYFVFRAPDVTDAARLATAQFRPDVVVIMQTGAWVAELPNSILNLPIVVYEHSVPHLNHVWPSAPSAYIANSATTATHLLRDFDIKSTVVPPLFGVERYAAIRRCGENILFVSIQRRKGADVAIRIAESRPLIPFIFVESWTENSSETQELREAISSLRNVTLLRNQHGLSNILPQIKLLLMPSRSQEAWGRTATEAQICGIPVLGSSRGNLPITVGAGGITLDPDEPIEHWLNAFDRIVENQDLYEDLSRKALQHGREAIQETRRAYDTFVHVLLETIGG